MITIKFSTVKDPASIVPQEELAHHEEPKKSIPLAWIPVTLGVGLLIAALYLKARIWTPHPHTESAPPQVVVAPPAKPHAPQPVFVETPPAAEPKLAEKSSEAPEQPDAQTSTVETPAAEHPFVGPTLQEIDASQQGMSLIAPHSGERYIQVGAFNEEATRRFVEHLRHTSRQPHVAAGPTPQILRVLIGPFDDPDRLAAEKRRLESEGVDTFVRKY